MQYIVLDMEWNQPWPGSPSAKKVLPSPIRGEIVQIGAVRMPRDGEVADEFQTLIRPAYYKKMNRKVASLTGIKDAILKEQGKPFPEAMQAFHDWCGEDSAFLTWGFDDIMILRENLICVWVMGRLLLYSHIIVLCIVLYDGSTVACAICIVFCKILLQIFT